MKHLSKAASFFKRTLPLSLIALLPSLAQAHPGVPGHSHGFVNGLGHPITGLDHLCAIVAVGLWAAQRGGRALWLVPLTFVSVMLIGGILGTDGINVPYVEQGIAASVLVLGIFIAAAIRLPLAASMVIVGLFALFHGYAHGAEMPGNVSGFAYGIGFIVATASLHLSGIALGITTQRLASAQMVRYLGGGIAACGVYLCFAL